MAKTPESDEPIIRCNNLWMQYEPDRPVLQGVSFQLKPGGFYFLTGPSGSGKSTLLSMLSLAQRPSKGQMSLFGVDTATLKPQDWPYLRRRVSLVFQDFRLLPHLTVEENVALPLKIAGVDRPTIRRNVDEMLDWIDMADFAKAMPRTLSGGQKQRVSIARAVINHPEVILADEPTGNLDPKLSVKCMKLFEALNQQGTTLVIATHDDRMVQRMGHPVLRLHSGKLFQEEGRLAGAA